MTIPRGLADVVPSGSYIDKYMKACDVLETAAEYDFWGAVWSLGSSCGRDVVVPRPFAPVYLNWYMLFVAESGVTRKSTAVRIARDAVRAVSDTRMVEQRASVSKLLNDMAEDSIHKQGGHVHIAVSELVTFLGKDRNTLALPGFLTDMYDCPDMRTGGGGMYNEYTVIKNAFVTFISASTPTWLRGAVNPDVVEGGFTSRCLFITCDGPKQKVPWPDPNGVQTDDAVDTLREVTRVAREVHKIEPLPAAMARYEQWYRSRQTSYEPFLASFMAREDSHVLRLAACLAINAGTYSITKAQMSFAIRAIAQVKADASRIFDHSVEPDGLALAAARTVELVCEAGAVGISHTELMQRIKRYASREALDVLLHTMHELHMIRTFEHKKARGRPTRVYARGKNIRIRRAMNDLHETLHLH